MRLFKLFLYSLLLLFIACNLEKKFAKQYVYYHSQPAILLIEPAPFQVNFYPPLGSSSSETFARRYFPYRCYDFINNGTEMLDSNFQNKLDTSLILKGYFVYSDTSAGDFLQFPGDKFVLEILQVNIEEYVETIIDSVETTAGVQYFDTLFSLVEFHVWLRLNPLDDTSLAAPVLYATLSLEDYFNGKWEYSRTSNQYYYSYVHDAIYAEDIIEFISLFTDMLSDYIYDYFMNMYIYERKNGKTKKYYSFRKGKIDVAKDDRFIFMEE
ncbi:MAG: hypothetical protein KAG99_04800 [Bacteroidales bacterium]|nr:hypothetical protein [Bacteroidales bacterium]